MRTLFLRVFLVLLTFALCLSTIFGQAPPKMSYQAVIRNSSDQLVTSTNVGMQIRILQGSTTGTAVYVETQTPTTNANGLVSLEIGSGTVVSGTFATIDWANDQYFIKIETDIDGGTNYTITGVSQLLSVSYALHAKTAETVIGEITETDPVFSAWDKDYADLTNTPTTITTAQSDAIVSNTAKVGYSDVLVSANAAVSANTAKIGITTVQSDAIALNTAKISAANGTQEGEMQYWNGTTWLTVASGQNGQVLKYKNGVPTWTDDEIINILSIGDSYQGGVIAYFLEEGDLGYDENVKHGLIAAKVDQSASIQWYNGSYTTTGALSKVIGSGQANTAAIISSQGAIETNYAAGIARAYNGGGYSDWYLPSKDELNKLYLNRTAVGGFANTFYWSSTEIGLEDAWAQSFNTGTQGYDDKSLLIHVRAIRAF